MIGWQFLEIGKEEYKPYPKGITGITRSAHYCENCYRFIGRWMVYGEYKVWCEDCIKIEDEGRN